MTDPPRPQYPIESVDRALRLLLLFEEHQTLRLSDAARAIGVADSTAHRLLSMLHYHGFLDRAGGRGAYRLGEAMLKLGLSAVRQLDIRVEAGPFLQRLVDETDETVHLAQLDRQQVWFIDSREGSQALRVMSRLGRTLPAHATSVGRAMLASLSMAELEALYPDHELPPPPPAAGRQPIQTWDDLLEALSQVRRTGFARNSGESEAGVSSVGVVLNQHLSASPTGLSVAVPSSRADPARLRALTAALRKTVADLETRLASAQEDLPSSDAAS